MDTPRIGFAGMTHLGLCSAVAAAELGFSVTGFDPSGETVALLTRSELPVSEPDLAMLLAKRLDRLRFTSDGGDLESCDVVFVSADVPTDDRARGDLAGIRSLIGTVVACMGPGSVLVILCQVPPGFTRRLGFPVPAERLYYQVETLVFGRAMACALGPERFIVGASRPEEPLAAAYRSYLGAFGCPIFPMLYESAELAKLSINCLLAAQLSVTSTLAELCERIGADWREIAPSLALDRRIGPHAYLTPGLGIGGGNLERDLAAIAALSLEHGTDSAVIGAVVHNSRLRRNWVLRRLHRIVLHGIGDQPIAILGLAYKAGTDSTKNSPSLALIAHLYPYALAVYDPVVSATVAGHPRTRHAASAMDAVRGARAVVIMTPWVQFSGLVPAELARAMLGTLVIDPYRALDGKACIACGLEYHALGVAPAGLAPA